MDVVAANVKLRAYCHGVGRSELRCLHSAGYWFDPLVWGFSCDGEMPELLFSLRGVRACSPSDVALIQKTVSTRHVEIYDRRKSIVTSR